MDFALDNTCDWKKDAKLLGKGGRREIYVYNGLIVKDIYNPYKINLNYLDYKNYLALENVIFKSSFKMHFVKLHFKNSFIISEIVKDYDSNISSNLNNYEGKISEEFWSKLKEILIFLMENNLYFYDLKSENIVVKKINDLQIIPVFIDYKWINKSYFLQLNLLFGSQKKKKVLRRFERLKEIIIKKNG